MGSIRKEPEEIGKEKRVHSMWIQVGVEEGWTPLGTNCLPRKMKDDSFLAKNKTKKHTHKIT